MIQVICLENTTPVGLQNALNLVLQNIEDKKIRKIEIGNNRQAAANWISVLLTYVTGSGAGSGTMQSQIFLDSANPASLESQINIFLATKQPAKVFDVAYSVNNSAGARTYCAIVIYQP